MGMYLGQDLLGVSAGRAWVTGGCGNDKGGLTLMASERGVGGGDDNLRQG